MKKALYASLAAVALIGAGCMDNTTTNTNVVADTNTSDMMYANENSNVNTDGDMMDGGDSMAMKIRNDVAGVLDTTDWESEVNTDPTFSYMVPANVDASFDVVIEPTTLTIDDSYNIFINGQPFFKTEEGGTRVYATVIDGNHVEFLSSVATQDLDDTFTTIMSTFSLSETPMGGEMVNTNTSDLMLQ